MQNSYEKRDYTQISNKKSVTRMYILYNIHTFLLFTSFFFFLVDRENLENLGGRSQVY
jgi:hypothetical protein